MRIIFFLFVISTLAFCQCKSVNSTCDLPPTDLVDTLIKEVIIQSEINRLNFDSAQIKFMKESKIPIIRYKLNNLINCYPVEQENNLVKSKSPTFSNSYFLSTRFTSNGKQIFTPEDTNVFNCQSKNAKLYHINHLLIPNIQLIDTTEIKKQISNRSIAKKMKIPFNFSYIEMYTPLLNYKKNKAIIGVSGYTMTEYIYQGFGNFIIMEKQGEKWKKINEVIWWSY